MRLRSFDIFDTLLTRSVAFPADLFVLCGVRLQAIGLLEDTPENFAANRILAERTARSQVSHAEPCFKEIYYQLAKIYRWGGDHSDAAARIELDCEESSLRAVPRAAAMLVEARQQKAQVVFISDMYLPLEFVRKILSRESMLLPGDRIYLSNESKVNKSSGGLFQLARDDFPGSNDWIHTGDNPHSDIWIPKRMKIKVQPFTDTTLRLREHFVAGDGNPLWRSQLAAAMRLTRLHPPPETSEFPGLWDEAVDVASPILFAYVFWVLEMAVRQGISRLYFVSRDGEVLLRIAHILVEEWKYPIECRYLYGSRQAWHASALNELGEFEKKWILERDIPLSLKTIAERLCMVPDDLAALLRAAGFEMKSVLDVIPITCFESLWQALQSAPVLACVRRAAQLQRETTIGYLRQEGLLADISWATVDVGWRGHMQHSLTSLLRHEGAKREPHGFFLGLIERGLVAESRTAFWNELTGMAFPRRRVTLIEIFTAGTEGSTMGYESAGQRFRPRLGSANRSGLAWGIGTLHDAACDFARNLCRVVQRDKINPAELGRLSIELFQKLYRSPTASEARVFGSFPHSTDQMETQFRGMLNLDLSRSGFAIQAWKRKFYHSHPWIEGQLVVTPSKSARWAHNLRRLKAKFDGKNSDQ